MKTKIFYKTFLPVLSGLLLGVLTDSCKRNDVIEPDPVRPGTNPIHVTFDITDGLLNADGVVSKPTVRLLFSSDDEYANYSFRYSVDGSTEKTIKALWDGAVANLTHSFVNLSKYGSYSLKGEFKDVADPSISLKVDTLVWMKYVPVDETSLSFITPAREGSVGSSLTLYEGEAGAVELSYKPVTTFLHVSAVSSDEKVLKMDASKARNAGGVYSIPFSALSVGTATLTVTTENGPERESREIQVDVKEDTAGQAVYVELDMESDLVFDGLPLTMVLETVSGASSRRFNIDYLVDGTVVATDASVVLSSQIRKSVDISPFGIGEHVAGIRVTGVDGRGQSIEREARFTIAQPRLEVTGGELNGALFGDGAQVSLDADQSYAVSVTGVPDAFVGRFALSVPGEGFSVSGTGPWSVTPTTYGRGTLMLRYVYGTVNVDVATVGVLRRDVCDLLLEWKHSKGLENGQMKVSSCELVVSVKGKYASSLSVPLSGTFAYHGVCEYPKASKTIKDETCYNTRETLTTAGGTPAWQADARDGGAKALDLLQEGVAIENAYVSASYWTMDTIREGYVVYDSELSMEHAYLADGTFYYELVVDAVTVRLSSSAKEGLVYRLKTTGLPAGVVSVSSPIELVK